MREFKSVPAFIKSVSGDTEGEDQGLVTHLISVYGIVDAGRDVAHKGMFTKTIQERGDQVRVLDNHQQGSVLHVVGKPRKLYEVGRDSLPASVLQRYPDATGGLMAETQFLMDTPEGKGAFTRIRDGAVSEFSFAYDALDTDFGEVGGKKVRNLRTVRLWEYGPVIFGMNDAAVAVGAKAEQPAVGDGAIRVDMEVENLDPNVTFETYPVSHGIKAVVGEEASGLVATAYLFDRDRWTPEAAKEWVEKFSGQAKELGVFRRAYFISDEFNSQFGWSRGGDEKRYSTHEIYEDYLLASTYHDPYYYKVGFTETEEGTYLFEEEESWQKGTLEFVATAPPPDEEGDLEKHRNQLLMQIKFMEFEAGSD